MNGYTCGKCGQFVVGSAVHQCPGVYVQATPYVQVTPVPGVPWAPLTEADVRRVVREEMRAIPRRAVARALPGRGGGK